MDLVMVTASMLAGFVALLDSLFEAALGVDQACPEAPGTVLLWLKLASEEIKAIHALKTWGGRGGKGV